MYTAHDKNTLTEAYGRLRDLFRKIGKTNLVYSDGEVIGERFEYELELKMLQSVDQERIRSWARQNSICLTYHHKEIRKALCFLSGAYVREGEYRVEDPVSYVENGEYAGDNSGLTVRPGTYPVVRMQRWTHGDLEDYAFVTVDGENTFVNRIGYSSSVRKTEIRGERRALPVSYLKALSDRRRK